MPKLSSPLSQGWLSDTEELVGSAHSITTTYYLPSTAVTSFPHAGSSWTPSSFGSSAAAADPTPYGVTAQQLDALSAMAYLVGSPLQRQQPVGSDMTHPALLVAAKLLQRGVDPERIIELIECRHRDAS
ncbi:hypothetical protein LSCM1_02621 [Leishmania martiniquensis]|uniref:Uncharacterized protein n=1 Tax=Leishmania martiniquensis TaxID=1580590 RepID=A0A836GC55_9TRYP|nr:hypothetical protein LSCM1_02621 [Leishmania martiniquensis]